MHMSRISYIIASSFISLHSSIVRRARLTNLDIWLGCWFVLLCIGVSVPLGENHRIRSWEGVATFQQHQNGRRQTYRIAYLQRLA